MIIRLLGSQRWEVARQLLVLVAPRLPEAPQLLIAVERLALSMPPSAGTTRPACV